MKKTVIKKTKKQSRWAKFGSLAKGHKVVTVVCVLIVLVGGYAAVFAYVEHRVENAERHRFAVAQQQLTALYGSAIKRVGEGSHAYSQSCSRTSAEFNEGFLSCDTYLYVDYAVQNLTQATKYVEQINLTIKSSTSGYRDVSWSDIGEGYTEIATNSFKGESGLSCGTDYWFVTKHYPSYVIQNINPHTLPSLLIRMGCSGSARAQYFPLVSS